MNKVIIVREENQSGCVGCIADGWYSCGDFNKTMENEGIGGCGEFTYDVWRSYIYKIVKEEE